MNSESIFQSQQKLKAINELYMLFVEYPLSALAILADSPEIHDRIIEARDNDRAGHWRMWEARNKSETPTPPEYAYAHYQFSAKDVSDYLIPRVWTLEYEHLQYLKAVAKSEVQDRLPFYVDFLQLLETLRDRLATFDEEFADRQVKHLTKDYGQSILTSPRAHADWKLAYSSLLSFKPEITHLVRLYLDVLTPLVDDKINESLVRNAERPTSTLTKRERVLIHCYEEREAIKRGDSHYSVYITYVTPKKRLMYPGESKRKAKLLIKAIETIIPLLSEKAAQMANREIFMLRSEFGL